MRDAPSPVMPSMPFIPSYRAAFSAGLFGTVLLLAGCQTPDLKPFAAATATVAAGITQGGDLALRQIARAPALMDNNVVEPTSAEFDPTAAALGEIAGKLQGQLTQAVFDELRSRTAILGAAVDTLAKVTSEAAADARILSFEKPKVLAAGLKNGIALVEEVQQAAKAGDIGAVSQKAEALLAVLATLRHNLKIG